MNIEKIIERGYYWIDNQARSSSLALARRISRRSFLSKLGTMLAGAAAFPLLPVARSFAQSSVEEVGDPAELRILALLRHERHALLVLWRYLYFLPSRI